MKIKHIILGLVAILFSIFFWGYLSLFFLAPSSIHFLYLVISWLGFFTFYLVLTLLINSRNLIYGCLLAFAAAFFIFFNQPADVILYYLLGALLFILFSVISVELILNEKENRLKLSFKKIWKRGLSCFITALALVIALVYYFNPLMAINQKRIEIPSEFFGFILRPVAGMVGKVIPFYDPKMTVDETLASSLIIQGKTNIDINDISKNVDLENFDINDVLKNSLAKKIIQEQGVKFNNQDAIIKERENLSNSLKIDLTGEETMEEILANLVNSKFSQFIGPYHREISIGIAITLFFILQLIGKILSFLAIILARIIFWLLMIFKAVKIEEKQKISEVIEF